MICLDKMEYLVIFAIGLCFGSFANALVWRIHKQDRDAKTKRKSKIENYSIVNGRSMCVHCKHILAWYDLLPVASWVILWGKCRYCHKPISLQYPVVELATTALFVISYIFWPLTLHTPYSIFLFATWLVLLTGFIALAVYDYKWMLLPDRIVFPLQAIAVVFVLTKFIESGGDMSVITGAFWAVMCSAGLFYVLFQISQGKWIGGGDVKLGVVLGLVLGGAAEALLMLFIASLLGSLIGIPLLLAKKTKLQAKLPFGPLLLIATFIVYLFGASVISWYKQQFLFV